MEYKKALITGATSGIGERLAYFLHQKNISLLLTGRNQKKLAILAKKLGAETLVADLAEANDLKAIVKWMKKHAPDLLINNAGFGFYGPSIELSLKDQKQILEVNGWAVFELTHELVKLWLKKQRKGVVLNISSIAGEIPMPGLSIYAAAKSFVTSFSSALDYELKKRGVRILVSCPGQITTQFASRAARKKVKKKNRFAMSPEYVVSRIWRQLTTLKQKDAYPFLQKMVIGTFPKNLLYPSIWKEIEKRL